MIEQPQPVVIRKAALPASMRGQRAGFVSRLLALGIDVALMVVTVLVAHLLWSALANATPATWLLRGVMNTFPAVGQWLTLIGVLIPPIISLVLVCGYFTFFFVFSGQTIGKRLMGLRVISNISDRMTFRQAVVRLVGYVLSALPLYFGFLVVLTDDRRRAWHDRLAKTTVIYAWEARPDERFLVRALARIRR